MRFIPQLEALEPRDAPTSGWSVESTPPRVTLAQEQAVIARSFAAWEAVANIPASIPVTFRAAPIDGGGKRLAETAWTGTEYIITLDTAEKWVISQRRVVNAVDLNRVILHELGHALRLPHTTAPYGLNIMNPQWSWAVSTLGPLDRAAALAIYGAPNV